MSRYITFAKSVTFGGFRATMTNEQKHISSPGRLSATLEHCWCNPQFRQACPECKRGEGLSGVAEVFPEQGIYLIVECWRCDGFGLVVPYDDLEPKIVIHNG